MMARSPARGVAYFIHTAVRAANCSLSLKIYFYISSETSYITGGGQVEYDSKLLVLGPISCHV